MEDDVGQVSKSLIMNDSRSQANGTDCVLLTIERLLKDGKWWDNRIRVVD